MNTPSTVQPPQIVRPGTGRIGVVSAYFHIIGGFGALITVGIGIALAIPRLDWRVTPAGHPIAALCAAVLLSVGYLRTGRLLSQRKKSGALLAVFCFFFDIFGSISGEFPGRASLAIAILGLALVLSVWRRLE